MTGSFETKGGVKVAFYGFYTNLADGVLVEDGASQSDAHRAVDSFIKSSFKENLFLNAYAYLVNIISLAPFIALMIMVVALLCYSILRLRGVESISSLVAMLKIVGSFAWFSAVISASLTLIGSFFVRRSLIGILPLLLFFMALVVRAMVFVIIENKGYVKQLELQKTEQTEV